LIHLLLFHFFESSEEIIALPSGEGKRISRFPFTHFVSFVQKGNGNSKYVTPLKENHKKRRLPVKENALLSSHPFIS